MKFYFCVLTAGLLVATAASNPSFGLGNPLFGKNIGIVAETNLAPTLTNCANTNAIGTLKSFTLTGCTAEPCKVSRGTNPVLAYTVGCGAPEAAFKLGVTANGAALPDIPPSTDASCSTGTDASPQFTMTIPLLSPPGNYSTTLSLKGSSQLETCVNLLIQVV